MQAIITKYFGPSESGKGSRIRAKCERGSITIPYPHEASIGIGAHRVAMQALIEKFVKQDEKNGILPEANPWRHPMITGALPSGEYVHVFAE